MAAIARPRPVRADGAWTAGGRLYPVPVITVGVAGAVLVRAAGASAGHLLALAAVVGLTAAACAAVRMAPSPVRALVAFTVGLIGTAVGLGVGLRHATKAGWSVASVAGSLSLAGGLLLLAAGAAALVRATPRWWRLLTVPTVLATTAVALWTMTIALAATAVPATRLDAATPADRGLRYLEAAFATGDGVRLSGWYLPSSNGAALVLLHGAGSTRSAVLDHATVLHSLGYGVLLYDARGHGRSDGRAMDFGWYGDLDVSAAVDYLTARADVDGARIAAVGMSMGGEQAIGAAASDHRLRAVVAEGVTQRTAADKAYLRDEYGWRGAIQQGIDQITFGLTDLLTAAGPPITLRDAVAAAAPRPVLLVTAGDVGVETIAAEYIQRGSPGTVQTWRVPDTGHTRGLATHPAEWRQRVGGFLAGALTPRRAAE